jgi:hypothetical protein
MNSLLLVAALLAGSPAAKPSKTQVKDANPCHHGQGEACVTPPAADADGVLRRGDKLGTAPRVQLAELLKSPQAHDGKTVAVEGKVRKACERKGCWMELATTEKGPGVRVTFKDYGFFVPLDSAGKTARVEGLVKLAELSEDTAKHYESEGAIVPRDSSGKPREVQLVATGVELHK